MMEFLVVSRCLMLALPPPSVSWLPRCALSLRAHSNLPLHQIFPPSSSLYFAFAQMRAADTGRHNDTKRTISAITLLAQTGVRSAPIALYVASAPRLASAGCPPATRRRLFSCRALSLRHTLGTRAASLCKPSRL